MTERRLSFSGFEDYTRCGEAYRLKRVVKVPQRPGMARVGGSAFHEWTEQYDLHRLGYQDEEPDPADAILEHLVATEEEESGVPRDKWQISGRKTKDKPNKENFEVWRDTLLPEMCEKYIEWVRECPWQIATDLPPDQNGRTVGVEYDFRVYIRYTRVPGIVDRVVVDEHGNYGAVDLKSWARERRSVQLPTYLVGLQMRGVPAVWGSYYHARKGVADDPKFMPNWTEQRLAALYDQAAMSINAGIFIPAPSDDCRSFCSVAGHCEYAV
ncbi:RecB family exonuclease [Saccharomonospora viridis]|uniref:RecB family exonuclease n=1 Tax=Saccharomonospora viridis TaxID=1852 RepID=UPI002409C1D1|nr:PD-(D/E)XK nuclease family protein [Saccharomonospora viridis]